MRVLVVEDDGRVRTALRRMLEGAGYEVEEVGDGKQAARARPADLVVCDLFMPETDGIEVVCDLRREFPAVKILAISGGGFQGQVDMLPTALSLGAPDILYKPFDQAAALAAITRLLPVPPRDRPAGGTTVG